MIDDQRVRFPGVTIKLLLSVARHSSVEYGSENVDIAVEYFNLVEPVPPTAAALASSVASAGCAGEGVQSQKGNGSGHLKAGGSKGGVSDAGDGSGVDGVDGATKCTYPVVCGVELGGVSTAGEWSTFEPLFARARAAGLPVALHCGYVVPRPLYRSLLVCKHGGGVAAAVVLIQ